MILCETYRDFLYGLKTILYFYTVTSIQDLKK